MMNSGNTVSLVDCRFDDVASEPLKMLMPIEGYEKMPLVSLEEAVEPLLDLVSDVRRKAWCAMEKVKECSLSDGLSLDESAAIRLYTMEWMPKDKCLYSALNTILRSDKPGRHAKLQPFFLYLKLFLTGLSRLPSERRFVYRGVKMDLSNKYTDKKEIVWWGFSSCTAALKTLESNAFLGTKGQRTMFTIDSISGKDIRAYSEYAIEDEILLFAATRFEVLSYLKPADDLHMIQLKEIQSPFPLLEPVSVSAVSGTASNNEPAGKYPPKNSQDPDDTYVETFRIVWLDANKKDEEIRDTERKLNSITNYFQRFQDVAQCQTYIEKLSQNDRLVLIVSGRLGREIVPSIHKLPQVMSIYVYCMDKKINEEWTREFEKVNGVVVLVDELISRIKFHLEIVERPTAVKISTTNIRTDKERKADKEVAVVPRVYPPLPCKGHCCTKCGKCSDWKYSGDSETWQWMKNFHKWELADKNRWCNGGYYHRFKLRDDATCNRSLYYTGGRFLFSMFSSYGYTGTDLFGHICVCD